MLEIDLVRRLRRVPPGVLLGLLLMAVGGGLDVAVHLGPESQHAHADDGSEHLAHLIGIAGMALVLAGVVIHGARRQRRQGAAQHGGLDPNASR